MKQGDKELLLKDISARFPYGVVLDVDTIDWRAPEGHIQVKIEGCGLIFKDMSLIVNGSYYGDNYKPYLRSMSSMTEEEKMEFDNFCVIDELVWKGNSDIGYKNQATIMSNAIIWLLKKRFDFLDLIPKGLAIEVTEENNPYK